MQTMKRFNHLNLAVAPRTLYRKLEELGSTFDSKLKDWIANGQFVESIHEYDVYYLVYYIVSKCIIYLIIGSVTFQIVGDNVDVYQKPRYMTAESRARNYHWFQVYAVKNRINLGMHIDYTNLCELMYFSIVHNVSILHFLLFLM